VLVSAVLVYAAFELLTRVQGHSIWSRGNV